MKASVPKFLKTFYKKSKRGTIKASRFTKKWLKKMMNKKEKNHDNQEKQEKIDPVEMKKREIRRRMKELKYTESSCIVPEGMTIDNKPKWNTD